MSFTLTIGTIVSMSRATDLWGLIGFPILAAALVWADLRAGRGLALIYRTNRSAPYFEGMSEAQKRAADQPPLLFAKPSFPDVAAVRCPEDARRYARRAKAIADIHTWTGAGIIVVFSAFVGTTISAMWEFNDRAVMAVPVVLVLGSLALGFGIQRRSREYLRLSAELHQRADELEKPVRPSTWIRRLRLAWSGARVFPSPRNSVMRIATPADPQRLSLTSDT